MIVLVPSMKLKNQAASAKHPIVSVAMAVFRGRIESKQLSIPVTACPYIGLQSEAENGQAFFPLRRVVLFLKAFFRFSD
jgi:hypothetical protein